MGWEVVRAMVKVMSMSWRGGADAGEIWEQAHWIWG